MIDFVPLSDRHLVVLHAWLQAPHVREVWDDGDRNLEDVERHYFQERDVEAFVIRVDGEAAGYLQAYEVSANADFAPWRAQVGETWGADLFIGETRFLSKGLGPDILRAFLTLWRQERPNLRRVPIDPETCNARAIHVYRKVGFQLLAETEHQGQPLALHALDL